MLFCPQTSDYLCFSCLPRVVQLHIHYSYYNVINKPQDHMVKLFLISMKIQQKFEAYQVLWQICILTTSGCPMDPMGGEQALDTEAHLLPCYLQRSDFAVVARVYVYLHKTRLKGYSG